MGMKWRDPMPVRCPACLQKVSVPAAGLKDLSAVCPRCGASLAAIGSWLLAEQDRIHAELDRAIEEIHVELDAGDRAGRPSDG
jgi:transcription initiation factor IIE alpha subunit